MKTAILALSLAIPCAAQQVDITSHSTMIDPGPTLAELQHQKADVDADILALQKKWPTHPDSLVKQHEMVSLQNRSRNLQNQIQMLKAKQPPPKKP